LVRAFVDPRNDPDVLQHEDPEVRLPIGSPSFDGDIGEIMTVGMNFPKRKDERSIIFVILISPGPLSVPVGPEPIGVVPDREALQEKLSMAIQSFWSLTMATPGTPRSVRNKLDLAWVGRGWIIITPQASWSRNVKRVCPLSSPAHGFFAARDAPVGQKTVCLSVIR
jgi:hypothetical protein